MEALLAWFKRLFETKKPADVIPIRKDIPIQNVSPVAAKPVDPPWMVEAKKHEGKKESDRKFSDYLSGFWKIVGLKGYVTIAGNNRAWCGLFVAAMLSVAGYQYQKNGAGAKHWAEYGVKIEYKTHGIPRGAVLYLNHAHECGSGKGNHVTFANGDCAPEDILKRDAMIDAYGGNQQNKAQVVAYSVKEICAVRWPKDYAFPAPVVKSVNCSGSKSSGGSTK